MANNKDYVCIEGLRVLGRHGVGDAERKVEQEFEISAKMEVDTGLAAHNDKLEDALDYAPIRENIIKVIQTNSFYLIEKLADALCAQILEDKRICAVELTVKKVAIWSNGVPGVTITRTN